MILKNFVARKMKSTKSWSAPTFMTVFICICMIIIFSFESLGLTNKDKNLEFRKTSLQTSNYIVIKYLSR